MKLLRLKSSLPVLFLSLCLLLGACAQSEPASSQSGSFSSQEGGASSSGRPGAASAPFTLAYYPSSSLDPLVTENKTNLTLAPLLCEGLFRLDNTFFPEAQLCHSYTVSEDGLVWSFTLVSNATFSDGTPLTGALAAQSLQRAAVATSNYAARLAGVSSIAGEGNTVTIVLSSPNHRLPALLDIPIVLETAVGPLGTGPYVLSTADGTAALTLRSGWWQNTILPITQIPLAAIASTDDLIAAFDAGEISLLDADLLGTNSLGYSGNYEIWDYATSTLVYLGLNAASGPMKDTALRCAISLAIDRDTITGISYANHAVSAVLPVHPSSADFVPSLASTAGYQPEQAVAALETISLSTPLRLLVSSENTTRVAAAQNIATQLSDIGIPVEIQKLPWEEYLTALQRGNFDLHLAEVLLTADFDLTQLLSSGGSINYGRWQNETTDALLSGFRAAQDSARTAAAQSLYTHLLEEMPIVPLCFKNGSVLTQWGQISGLNPVQRNVFYGLEQWGLS